MILFNNSFIFKIQMLVYEIMQQDSSGLEFNPTWDAVVILSSNDLILFNISALEFIFGIFSKLPDSDPDKERRGLNPSLSFDGDSNVALGRKQFANLGSNNNAPSNSLKDNFPAPFVSKLLNNKSTTSFASKLNLELI